MQRFVAVISDFSHHANFHPRDTVKDQYSQLFAITSPAPQVISVLSPEKKRTAALWWVHSAVAVIVRKPDKPHVKSKEQRYYKGFC